MKAKTLDKKFDDNKEDILDDFDLSKARRSPGRSKENRQGLAFSWFPRSCVGTHTLRYVGIRMHSHAGAWERECNTPLSMAVDPVGLAKAYSC